MKKNFVFALVVVSLLAVLPMFANDIPDCRLGVAPVNINRAPAPGDQKFTALKGAVVRMEFRSPGQQRLTYVRCRLEADTESYAVGPGLAWDVPSGNDFRAEGWTIPYVPPKGEKGDTGAVGPQGPEGPRGPRGFPGEDFLPRPSWLYRTCGASWPRRITCGVIVGGGLAALKGGSSSKGAGNTL